MAKLKLAPHTPEHGYYCGWFSPQQCDIVGYDVYDVNGNEVFTTMLTKTTGHNTEWDDIEFVGYVRDFKRSFRKKHSVENDWFLDKSRTGQEFRFFTRKNRSSSKSPPLVIDYIDPPYMRDVMANKKVFGKAAEDNFRSELLKNIGIPQKNIEERSTESPEPRFSVTDFYMEASSYVKHQLWKMRTDSGRYQSEWKDESSGFLSQITELNGNPVNLTFFWTNVSGKRVLFYDCVTLMIDRAAALSYIKTRCINAKPWPEPDIERPERKAGQTIQADDPRFKEVICAIEANRIEYALCVKENQQNFSTWVAEARVFIDFPDIDGRKSYAHLSFDRIEGKLVCFWDACSEVFNIEEIVKVFATNGGTKTTDCENFGVCKTQIRS